MLEIPTKDNQCAQDFHGFLSFILDNVLMYIAQVVTIFSSQFITIALFSTIFTVSFLQIPIETIQKHHFTINFPVLIQYKLMLSSKSCLLYSTAGIETMLLHTSQQEVNAIKVLSGRTKHSSSPRKYTPRGAWPCCACVLSTSCSLCTLFTQQLMLVFSLL